MQTKCFEQTDVNFKITHLNWDEGFILFKEENDAYDFIHLTNDPYVLDVLKIVSGVMKHFLSAYFALL